MIKVAVGIIIHDDTAPERTTVLLCQRRRTARYPLKWEFPGGKIEDSESVETGLMRELHEELNIHAEIGKMFHRQHYIYPDSGTFDVFYHLVHNFSGAVENRVFESLAWVPIQRIPHYDILEGNKEVVAKLLTNYEPAEPEKN